MDSATTDSCAAEEDECSDSEVLCLMRVGRNSDWLRLFENTEITVGRGVNVTYQLISQKCPLMISRLHCTFQQRDDDQWTVTDTKSLNGVWVNGNRIPPNEAHLLRLGDSIQLGVPLSGSGVEFDYILVQRSLKDIKLYLTKWHGEVTKGPHIPRKSKRKLAVEEVEPSTSKLKLYRWSSSDKSFAKPSSFSPVKCQQTLSHTLQETSSNRKVQEAEPPSSGSSSSSDLCHLQRLNQDIQILSEHVEDIQRQMTSPDGEPKEAEQIQKTQSQPHMQQGNLHQPETLNKFFSESKRQTENQEIEEPALSRQAFEEMLSAKNKELEVTKEEKEKARAQKEEVVTQVTEVLENELQCIICSELFIEAVTLNCAHSFCLYCINQWRKKKDECPICRQAIQSQTHCLALDNCIDGMVENLSSDMKARRQALIAERKGER